MTKTTFDQPKPTTTNVNKRILQASTVPRPLRRIALQQIHRNDLVKRHIFVLARCSTRNPSNASFLDTDFPHFTGRLAPRFVRYHPSSRTTVLLVASTSHIQCTVTAAAPQGNEIRASEDPRASLNPKPAQIRHDQAKFDQPAARPQTLTEAFSKHRRFPDFSVMEPCSKYIEMIYLSATYLY